MTTRRRTAFRPRSEASATFRGVLAFALVSTLACGGPAPESAAPDAPAQAVSTETAMVRSIPRVVEAGGVIHARTSAAIASRIVATVTAVHAQVGDRVREGQTLITLDSRDLDASRDRAAAMVTALEYAAAAVAAENDNTQASLTLARATHERIAALHAKNSATAHELDEAVSALRGAEARLRAATARDAEVNAQLASARAAASAAEVTASFSTLTSPFAAVVSEKLVEPGNLASPGVPLLRVEDTRGFRLEARIDASRAGQIAVGAPVEVVLGETSTRRVPATVTEVARAVDASSLAVLVKIDLPSDPSIRSGLFARARFGGEARQALTVPARAIVDQGQLTTVFVVSSDDRARMRVVRVGESFEGFVEIVAGLTPGEQVIVSPPLDLRDGDLLRPAPEVAAITGGTR